MGGLDPAKLIVILVLAMVLLGPERLPKAARQIGAVWHDVTRFRERVEEEVRREVRNALPDVDIPKIPTMPRGGLTGYLTGMMTETERNARNRAAFPGEEDDSGEDDDGVLDGFDGIDADDIGATGVPAGAGRLPSRAWKSSSRFGEASANPSPVTAPAGVPAGWHARGSEAPGYASAALYSAVPSAPPEAMLGVEIRPDLSDPSWN